MPLFSMRSWRRQIRLIPAYIQQAGPVFTGNGIWLLYMSHYSILFPQDRPWNYFTQKGQVFGSIPRKIIWEHLALLHPDLCDVCPGSIPHAIAPPRR
jgi:hypothetical protein